MGTHLLRPVPVDVSAEPDPPTDNLTTETTSLHAIAFVASEFWRAVVQLDLDEVLELTPQGPREPDELLAELGRTVRRARTTHTIVAHVDAGEGQWLVWVDPSSGRWTLLLAALRNRAEPLAAAARSLFDGYNKPRPQTVPFRFWSLGSCGEPDWFLREVPAGIWEDIECNYATAVRPHLARLVHTCCPEGAGKLVLLHGPPGTGKTTFIRALARAWAGWADAAYIVDPEKFFSVPAYLLSVATNRFSNEADVEPRWTLLVVEDADELLLADAKERSGQSLARLLNLTDGLLGEGLRLLILITTNVDHVALHPALRRPGRCLANIAIGPFDTDEAGAWLAERGCTHPRLRGEQTTVAELYELLSPTQVEGDVDPAPRAGYL